MWRRREQGVAMGSDAMSAAVVVCGVDLFLNGAKHQGEVRVEGNVGVWHSRPCARPRELLLVWWSAIIAQRCWSSMVSSMAAGELSRWRRDALMKSGRSMLAIRSLSSSVVDGSVMQNSRMTE
eukprot:9468291-Pyramimonas_sp.AAC.2